MIGSTSLVPPTLVLTLFLSFLIFVSVTLKDSAVARVVSPLVVLLVCWAQGVVFAEIVYGINAIGHS
jgi:hypothetical protein